MKVVIPVTYMVHHRPPAPYVTWGPQAVLRHAALKGFDFSRPYRGGWDDPENPKAWFFEHVRYGQIVVPTALSDPENVARERDSSKRRERRAGRASHPPMPARPSPS